MAQGGGPRRRAIGIVRLAHPFPSLLNSLATFLIATLAGGGLIVAGRLAVAMLGMQVSIGALNDLVDAERDAVVKPGKPLPSGLATARDATAVTVLGAFVMAVFAFPSGLGTVAVAALGLGLGFLYDLRLSRTPLSWLPLSFALPLVPILAWLGTTGAIPARLLLLGLVAVPAGFMLALANGLVDVERDRASGKDGIVVTLGPDRAWLLDVGTALVVAALAVALIPAMPPGGVLDWPTDDWGRPAAAQRVGLAIGLALLAAGAWALRSGRAAVRERGWELQAGGVLVVGVAWIAGLTPSG